MKYIKSVLISLVMAVFLMNVSTESQAKGHQTYKTKHMKTYCCLCQTKPVSKYQIAIR